jgi:hypothetical protein
MAIVTPLLTDQACRATSPVFTSLGAPGDAVDGSQKRKPH